MIYICSDKNCYYIAESEIPLLKCPDCGKELKKVREEVLDPARLNSLGVWRMQHLTEEHLEEDLKRAASCFERAYLLGNPIAAENLGLCYERGDGMEKSIDRAVQMYRYAAEHGNISACYRFGNCCYEGVGREKSYENAFTWYQNAAEKKHASATNMVGYMYEYGQGTAAAVSRTAILKKPCTGMSRR